MSSMDLWELPSFKDEDGTTWVWDSATQSFAPGDPDGLRYKVDRNHASGGDNDLFSPNQWEHHEQTGNPLQEGLAGGSSSGNYLGSVKIGSVDYVPANPIDLSELMEVVQKESWTTELGDTAVSFAIIDEDGTYLWAYHDGQVVNGFTSYGQNISGAEKIIRTLSMYFGDIPSEHNENYQETIMGGPACDHFNPDPGDPEVCFDCGYFIEEHEGYSPQETPMQNPEDPRLGGTSYWDCPNCHMPVSTGQGWVCPHCGYDANQAAEDQEAEYDADPWVQATPESPHQSGRRDGPIGADENTDFQVNLNGQPYNPQVPPQIGLGLPPDQDYLPCPKCGAPDSVSQTEYGNHCFNKQCNWWEDQEPQYKMADIAPDDPTSDGMHSDGWIKTQRHREGKTPFVTCPNCQEKSTTDICPGCGKSLTPEWNKQDDNDVYFDNAPQNPMAGTSEFYSDPLLDKVPRRNWMKTDDTYPSMISKVASDHLSHEAPSLDSCPECGGFLVDRNGEKICSDCGTKQPIINQLPKDLVVAQLKMAAIKSLESK